MIWIKILTSSVGKKFLMSLLGLFLIIFLLTHLSINLLMIFSDSTNTFNIAAHFMGSNIVIKIFEIILFFAFAAHIIMGIILHLQNWQARPVKYKVSNFFSQTSFFSKWVFHTAVIIFVFLVIHLTDFFYKIKVTGEIGSVLINGKEYHDTAALVLSKFQLPGFVIFYFFSMVVLAFHLNHGFQSAFQTLGVNHRKYTPFIKLLGRAYSIVIPAGFAFIAVYFYLR
jgi:succinate dehydrogenase / fumarate reductase, cytochrome b subunit